MNKLTCNIYKNYMKKHEWRDDWPYPQTRFECYLELLEKGVQFFYDIINRVFISRNNNERN